MKWIIRILLIVISASVYGQKISQMDSTGTLSSTDTLWFPVYDPTEALTSNQNKRASLYSLDQLLGSGAGDGINNLQTTTESNSVYYYDTISGAERINVFFIPSSANTDALAQAETILYFGQDKQDTLSQGIRSSSSGILKGNLIQSLSQSTRSYMEFYVTQGFNNLTDTERILRLEHGTTGNVADFEGSTVSDVGTLGFTGGAMSLTGSSITGTGNITINVGASNTVQTDADHTSNISAANDVITKGYADANYGSGTGLTDYTPTEVDSTNTDSHAFLMGFYTNNNGNVILHLSGQVDPTAASTVTFTFSLPVTSGMTVGDVIGHGQSGDGRIRVDQISGGANARLIFDEIAGTTTTYYSVTIAYIE